MPIINALIGIFLAKVIGMSSSNALLFAVLCASAYYIAVPAAIRMTVAEANPNLYISLALALTFPFNIIRLLALKDSLRIAHTKKGKG